MARASTESSSLLRGSEDSPPPSPTSAPPTHEPHSPPLVDDPAESEPQPTSPSKPPHHQASPAPKLEVDTESTSPSDLSELHQVTPKVVKKLKNEFDRLASCLPTCPLDPDARGIALPVYDHFVIVGRDPSSEECTPAILYSHAPTGRPDITSELEGRVDLPAFCFPTGLSSRQIRRSKSDSDLSSFMFGHTEPDCPEHSHVFQFSGLAGNLYGVCVYNNEILEVCAAAWGIVLARPLTGWPLLSRA